MSIGISRRISVKIFMLSILTYIIHVYILLFKTGDVDHIEKMKSKNVVANIFYQ